MAGLNDVFQDTEVVTKSMPGWFNTAQENLVKNAASTTQPAIGETSAKYAMGAFGPESTFSKGASALENIATGAVNPWLVTTGAGGEQTVAPNVNTAMGGLFQAQTDYLNQIMPDIAAKENAQAISGGGFGSRMNLSGVQRAQQQAASDLFQKQMQAAIQNQQTGVQAGAGLGNLGSQEVKSALDTANLEQGYPYAGMINQANIFGKIRAPEREERVTELSKLAQLGGLNQLIKDAPTGISSFYKGITDFGDWLGGKLGDTSQYTLPDYSGGNSYDDYEYWGYNRGGGG